MLLLDDTKIFIYPKSDSISNYCEFGSINMEPLELNIDGYPKSSLRHHIRTMSIANFTSLCAKFDISYSSFHISTDSTSLREHIRNIEIRAEVASILRSQIGLLNAAELKNLKRNLDSGHCSLLKMSGSGFPEQISIPKHADTTYSVPWQFVENNCTMKREDDWPPYHINTK